MSSAERQRLHRAKTNSTDIRFNMSSAERQRLHRANLSDVQRVNNTNRDNASRIIARGELSEEEIEDIRVAIRHILLFWKHCLQF